MFDYLDCDQRVFEEASGQAFTVMEPQYFSQEIDKYKADLKERIKKMEQLADL